MLCKTLDACHAMEHFGIKPAKTKIELKRLLKLYDNSWELIEDENYKALFDALLPDEEEKKPSLQTAPVHIKFKASELLCKKSVIGKEKKYDGSPPKLSLDPKPSRNSPLNAGQSGTPQTLLTKARVRCQKVADLIREKPELISKKKEAPPDNKTMRVYTRRLKKQASSLSKSCMEGAPSSTHQGDDDPISGSKEAQPPVKKCRLSGQKGEAIIGSSQGVIYNNRKRPSNEVAPEYSAKTSLPTMSDQNHGFMCYDSEDSDEIPLISRTDRRRHLKENVLVPDSKLISGIPRLAESPIVISLDSSSDSERPSNEVAPESSAKTSLPTMSDQNHGFMCYDSEDSEEIQLIRRHRGRHQKENVLVPESNGFWHCATS